MQVFLEAGDRSTVVNALVDSGAHRTHLPLSVAVALELDGELQRDPGRTSGVGSSFETWTHPRPIQAQAVVVTPEGEDFWGPIVELRPAFSRQTAMLLGRADFFRAFQVLFDAAREPPQFVLTSR